MKTFADYCARIEKQRAERRREQRDGRRLDIRCSLCDGELVDRNPGTSFSRIDGTFIAGTCAKCGHRHAVPIA